jgi:NHL repeat
MARRLLVVLVGVLVLGLASGAPAWGAPSHVLSFSFGSLGAGAGQMYSPQGVAMNYATGDVYVADTGNARVDEFDSSGNFIRAWGWGVADGAPSFETCTLICQQGLSGRGVGQFTKPAYIAVDNSSGPSAGDVYVGDTGEEVESLITKFDENGNLVPSWGTGGQLSESAGKPLGGITGIAVDGSGNVFTYTFNPEGSWLEFAQDGTADPPINLGVTTTHPGVGVDSEGDFYLNNQLTSPQGVYRFTSSGSEVGDVTPDAFTQLAHGFAIDPATNDLYVDTAGEAIRHYVGAGIPSCASESNCQAADLFGAEDLDEAAGLTVDAKTGTVYVADEGNSRIAVFVASPPSVDSAAATSLTSSSADLTARIDPNGVDTRYRIEWGTSTAYGASVPVADVDLGAGTSDVAVSQHLGGLSANKTYHWRVALTDAKGTIDGSDHTFVYTTTASQALPDGRGYEQVTPVQKNSALVASDAFPTPVDISGNGSHVVFTSAQCFAGAGSCSVQNGDLGDPFASTRTSAGWVTAPWLPPAQLGDQSPGIFSADAGTALFAISTPPAGEDDLYARRADESLVDIGPYSPPANGPLGVSKQFLVTLGETYATADLSRVAWTTELAFKWPYDSSYSQVSSGGEHPTSYEYSGAGNSQPALVGVTGGEGSTSLISNCGTEVTGPGSLSEDGSTVFFKAVQTNAECAAALPPGEAPLPADEVGARVDGMLSDAHTVILSQRSPADCMTSACLSSTPEQAIFYGASSDGSKAFFTSTQQLTDSASQDSQDNTTCANTTHLNGCNLYLYDFDNAAGHELVDVSAGDTSGGGPRVQGVVAFSSDGSHVYFVARGVLSGAPNAAGQSARAGAENLYVFERDAAHPAGQISFVTELSHADAVRLVALGSHWPVANVTPDGRFLVFTNKQSLTSDATSHAEQVYRYDARSGVLVRISTSSEGFNDGGNAGVGDATIVPAWEADRHPGPARFDPTMSDDGSYVFFQSPIGLTPHALDDVVTDAAGDFAQNVYEWHDGRVSLISDGRDTSAGVNTCLSDARFNGSAVCLLGSDSPGANVFFTTADQLVAQDDDTQLDIYDARIGGGFQYTQPESCQGDGCQGPQGSPPSAPGVASATFSGPGNVAESPPRPAVKKRVKNVKKHVKRRSRRRRPVKHSVRRTARAVHGRKGGRR